MDERAKNSGASGLTGAIVTPPDHVYPIGTELHFQAEPFFSRGPGRLASLENWDYFKGCLLALHFDDGSHRIALGSAVLVAPGVALSAAHVVESTLSAILAGDTHFFCTGISNHGLMIWRARKVTLIKNTDLAILGLEFCSEEPPDRRFYQAGISTRLPTNGESIMIAGYRQYGDIPTDNQTNIHGSILVAGGRVSEVYLAGRDQHLLPYSSIEVLCYAMGGMSGGPAFDSSGHLIGIISSSLQDATESGPTYVSLIWPVLGQLFECTWPDNFYTAPISLLNLDPRICSIDDRSVLSTKLNAETGQTTTRYNYLAHRKNREV